MNSRYHEIIYLQPTFKVIDYLYSVDRSYID